MDNRRETTFRIKTPFNNKGIKYFGMSGSGPTCFGIFRKKEEAIEATLNILKIRPKWWIKHGQLLS